MKFTQQQRFTEIDRFWIMIYTNDYKSNRDTQGKPRSKIQKTFCIFNAGQGRIMPFKIKNYATQTTLRYPISANILHNHPRTDLIHSSQENTHNPAKEQNNHTKRATHTPILTQSPTTKKYLLKRTPKPSRHSNTPYRNTKVRHHVSLIALTPTPKSPNPKIYCNELKVSS